MFQPDVLHHKRILITGGGTGLGTVLGSFNAPVPSLRDSFHRALLPRTYVQG